MSPTPRLTIVFFYSIISNITTELNQRLSDTLSTKAEYYKLHTALSVSEEQTTSADSQNRSSSVQLRHQRHQRSYWLSGISKWALATRGEEALRTKPCTHANSIRLAWAQHFSSAAALCCLENWKILLMLLASSCYLPEADAVICESVGTERVCSFAALFFRHCCYVNVFFPRSLNV